MKIDIHNHLQDKETPDFDRTIDYISDKGLDAFGIADSDDSRYERFIEQKGKYNRLFIDGGRAVYVPEKKVLVIKCQETFTRNGHVLAIAMPYDKHVKTKNLRDAIHAAKDLDAILDAVHPYSREGIGKFLEENPDLIEKFSLWEVYNASAEFSFPFILPRGSNEKAREFYFNNFYKNATLDIGISSATDGHSIKVVGRSYTNIEMNFFYSDSEDSNFVKTLDSSLRRVKTLDKLHMEPNRKEAAAHAFKMAVETLRGKRKI